TLKNTAVKLTPKSSRSSIPPVSLCREQRETKSLSLAGSPRKRKSAGAHRPRRSRRSEDKLPAYLGRKAARFANIKSGRLAACQPSQAGCLTSLCTCLAHVSLKVTVR